jgi:DNA-binding PadR family transcriptional regulator
MHLWPAMLYRSLETLEGEGLLCRIEPPAGAPDDERRQYYTLTAPGRARLAEEAEMLGRWVADAKKAAAT